MWKISWLFIFLGTFVIKAEDPFFPTVTSIKELQDFKKDTIVWKPDGSTMVPIPIGPETQTFYMDKYEVTNAQYLLFLQATGYPIPTYWDDPNYNRPDQPVVGISWYDANAYALWSGKQLPTENQWLWAAQGGLKNKKYPWGNERPDPSRVNYNRQLGQPGSVGSYLANGYGLHDMSGNVWEWCQDWFDRRQNSKSLRGGSWTVNKERFLRSTSRSSNTPSAQQPTYGFRCVINLDGTNNSFLSMRVSIPDKNLNNRLKQLLVKNDDRSVQIKDMVELMGKLELSDSNIASLTGLEYCTDLTILSLNNNQITDISSLFNLPDLVDLSLANNQINDISVLSNLTNLTTLNLNNNQIIDFSPLAKLRNLKKLHLENSGQIDTGVLSELTNLTELYLGNSQINDISALSNLHNLDKLDLGNNSIIDVEPLSNLTDLMVLDLGENQINDIRHLSDLVNLIILKLDNNKINDLRSLANLYKLQTLDLGSNSMVDTSSLSKMTNLTELNLSNNEINDISVLSNLTNLRVLNIQDNKLAENATSTINILKSNGTEVRYDVIPGSMYQKPDLNDGVKTKPNRNLGPFSRSASDYYTNHGATAKSAKNKSKTKFSLNATEMVENKGRIYIYTRPKPLFENAPVGKVRLDGEVIGKAKDGRFFYVDKEPGEYTLSIDSLWLQKKSLKVTLESDQTLYVNMKLKSGMILSSILPILVSAEEGKHDIHAIIETNKWRLVKEEVSVMDILLGACCSCISLSILLALIGSI